MSRAARPALLLGLLVAVLAGLLAGPRSAGPVQAQERLPAGPVVLLGAPGLRWDHVQDGAVPRVAALAARGSSGALSTRSASARTCPGDGWVMAGAGNRARLGPTPSGLPCPGRLAGREALPLAVRDNATLRFDSEVAALGRVLRDAGRCVRALGGPGAELATGEPADPLTASTLAAASAACDLVVVDAGAVHDDARLAGDLARVDAAVGLAADALRGTDGTLLVAGLSPTSELGAERAPVPRLHVAAALGPVYQGGDLVSASTRRAPYVQVVDLAPTALRLLGVPQPETMTGQPWRAVPGRTTVAELVDLDLAAGQMRVYTPRFFLILVVAQLVLYGAALVLFRHLAGDRDGSRRVLRLAGRTALAFAAAPVATYLANLLPWWRADPVAPALLGAVALFDLLVVLVALSPPFRRPLLGPVGVVCGITALVLAADLVTGARLQMNSVAGYSPLVAGRFAGVGNVAFAVFAASALLATAALCAGRSRRTVLLLCGGIGTAAVAVDGNPAWGSDFGGVLALIPGFALLAMLAGGIRVSVLRLAGVGAAAVLAVGTFATLDYLRPPDSRSHLGRFVGQVLDGGAGTVLERKAAANLGLLTSSVLTLLVPLLVLFVAQVVLRPRGPVATAFEQAPVWRSGLIAVLVMSLVGFAANDSGVAVPALALTIAVPASIAVVVRATARERESRALPAPAPAVAGAAGPRPPGAPG